MISNSLVSRYRTIKPLIKKPIEEKKREPSPELAKISALVTRPPKQKLTSEHYIFLNIIVRHFCKLQHVSGSTLFEINPSSAYL